MGQERVSIVPRPPQSQTHTLSRHWGIPLAIACVVAVILLLITSTPAAAGQGWRRAAMLLLALLAYVAPLAPWLRHSRMPPGSSPTQDADHAAAGGASNA